MTITSYTLTSSGRATVVVVESDLVGDVVFHWYIDGAYVGQSKLNRRTFVFEESEQVSVEVLDTTDTAFDPIANAPIGFPGRRTLEWTRPTDADLAAFRVEEKAGGGDWEPIATIAAGPGRWRYTALSTVLTNGETYRWRIIPIDAAGNEGASWELGPETVVKRPPGLDFGLDVPLPGRVRITEAV